MAFPQINHSILEATFKGTSHTTNEGTAIHSFRGVPYARISARFEYAQLIDKYVGGVVNATTYGPRCPQVYLDVRHLLRIPEDIEMKLESEDEFGCLNLDITSPPVGEEGMGCLPVVIWIHGGSQVVRFCSAASGICDPTKLVAESIQRKQPMIFVTVNYRLNIFSFGDGKEKNLGLKDQRLAIEWVRRNIASFGGDPENITLAGESAGAVYTHAHLITGPPVKRAVLASGSLYLSSPLPVDRGDALIKALEAKVQGLGQSSLREASASTLVRALEECNVNAMWLQEEPELQNWESKQGQVEEVMIGDTEFESVIWRNGIESLDAASITAVFNTQSPIGPGLRKLYQVVPSRPTASKLGALDLVHDARYSLPVELISESLQTRGTTVYKYLIDQPNPWQPSSRSHHAVDLLFLFGGVDLSFNPGAESIGQEMRRRWISFVNGKVPWSGQRRFAYGPLGECREIDEAQFAARRRVGHINALRQAGRDAYMAIVSELTAGKISLLN